MKPLLFILISFVWLPVIATNTHACSCIEYGVPVCAVYWRSDAVFAGQVLDITPVKKTADDELPTVTLHFIVEERFRGVDGNRVEVRTLHGTSCDLDFKKGKRYLVYASRDEGSGQLFAGACSRTGPLEDAADDLSYLRTVTQQGAQETISGRLVQNQYEELPGFKITVQSNDKSFETRTDEHGAFAVPVPGPGTYKVRASFPYAAIVLIYSEDQRGKTTFTDDSTTFEYEVQLDKNQCNYRQLDSFRTDLRATAQVSGSVLTGSGQPVSPGFVYLVSAADPKNKRSKKLEDNGSFKFLHVVAGEYYLVLNPRNEAPSTGEAPYPRTYYPNAAEESAATKIVVTEDAKLENLTLRLGPAWKARGVTGKVVWPDGSPAQGAYISLYGDNRFVRLIELDETGRFNFKVYGDFKYAISAESWEPKRGKSERLSIIEKSTGLKLVLQHVQEDDFD